MIRFPACLALGAALLAAPALEARERPSGEEELAKLLEGRVAGEPQSCIRTHPSRNFRVIEGTAIVFEVGRTIYVNIPAHPESLDRDDGMLSVRHSSSLCRTDIVTTFDTSSGFYTGNIFLGHFIPYRKEG